MEGRIAAERLLYHDARMAADAFIHCRVPATTKAAFGVMARHQGMTDSALLRRMIDLSLQSAGVFSGADAVATAQPSARMSRLTVRLRGDDQLLLQERAAARNMAAATYISVYVRAHLRSLAPLPKEELLALKKTIAELGAIGRNLNQIARAANQGERVDGPGQNDIRVMLRICQALRDHVKALLLANLRSWEQGANRENVFLKERLANDVQRFAAKTDAERQLPEGASGASRPKSRH